MGAWGGVMCRGEVRGDVDGSRSGQRKKEAEVILSFWFELGGWRW